MKKYKSGFTLAEVLITLGIIGVVAAVAMPSVIADGREKENISKVKKIFSALTQDYTMAVNINGTPDTWNLVAANSAEGAVNLLNILRPYFRVNKLCNADGGCWYNKNFSLLNKSQGDNYGIAGNFSTMQISDGMLLAFKIDDPNCNNVKGNVKPLENVCATIAVDINQKKGPNLVGYDIYYFYLTKYGIHPFGLEEDTTYPFKDTCSPETSGYGCTAWVVYNNNMDYIHCKGLDWKTKTKCKKGDEKYNVGL